MTMKISTKDIIAKLKKSYLEILFGIILAYISFINLFILKSSPEIIALQFAFLVFIFYQLRIREFAKFWIPFMSFFFLYEYLRGYVDDISPFYNLTLYTVYEIESYLFGVLPSIQLQTVFTGSSAFLNVLVFFYTIFFYYSFLVAFILWFKKSPYFASYAKRFLGLSFVGLLIFFFAPTAPPWFVALERNLPLERYLYTKDTILNDFVGVTIWSYFIYGNKVAALPSLHTAWPAFTTHFVIHYGKSRFRYLLLIIPAAIGFCVILTGEHYVIDVALGWSLAILAVYVPSRYFSYVRLKEIIKKVKKTI